MNTETIPFTSQVENGCECNRSHSGTHHLSAVRGGLFFECDGCGETYTATECKASLANPHHPTRAERGVTRHAAIVV